MNHQKVLSTQTTRMYSSMQDRFKQWCKYNKVRFPPADPAVIADYLKREVWPSAPSSIPVHVSAIGRMYRDAGRAFDPSRPAIKQVVKDAREAMRKKYERQRNARF